MSNPGDVGLDQPWKEKGESGQSKMMGIDSSWYAFPDENMLFAPNSKHMVEELKCP